MTKLSLTFSILMLFLVVQDAPLGGAMSQASSTPCTTVQCFIDQASGKSSSNDDDEVVARPAPAVRAKVEEEPIVAVPIFPASTSSKAQAAVSKAGAAGTSSGNSRSNRRDNDDDDEIVVTQVTPERTTEAGTTCDSIACFLKNHNPQVTALNETRDAFKNVIKSTTQTMSNMKVAKQCSSFADAAEIKSYGKVVVAEMNKPNMSKLRDGTKDIHRICPNYDNMTDEQVDGFWIALVSGWAHGESSCDSTAYLNQKSASNPGGAPNGRANGLLALHYGHEHEYSNSCRQYDSRDPARSIRCGLGMLNDRAQKGLPVFADHHFEVLNPNASRRGRRMNPAEVIMSSLRQYPYCHSDNAPVKTVKR